MLCGSPPKIDDVVVARDLRPEAVLGRVVVLDGNVRAVLDLSYATDGVYCLRLLRLDDSPITSRRGATLFVLGADGMELK